jgi:hypothetical protein
VASSTARLAWYAAITEADNACIERTNRRYRPTI